MQYKLAFPSFSVNSLEKAREFYENTLGLKVSDTKEGGLELHLVNNMNVFIYQKTDHVPATFTVLNFSVENIEQSVEELKNSGVTFERYDSGMIQTDDKGIARGKSVGIGPDIAWFRDPAGNFLSVLEE